jgi:glycosyltransferase involved in cell wall biosynthesis
MDPALTSEQDRTPNVVLKAIADAIPVVTTGVDGVPEIRTNKCRILIELSGFSELVSVTSKPKQVPGLRHYMSKNGQDYVANNHSFKDLPKRLVDIYSKALGDGQK